MKTNPKVDFFFIKANKWQEEFGVLRTIVLGCGLTEELKWGQPCYTKDGNNIVLIHGFKEYCALLFFEGALLKDTHKMLIRQTENVQAARQLRFAGAKEIKKKSAKIKSYIKQAITAEKAGLKVKLKKTSAFPMPKEFKSRLDESPSLKKAFSALTPGRQRAYLLFFSSAKQPKTREARIEKCRKWIMEGKGLKELN